MPKRCFACQCLSVAALLGLCSSVAGAQSSGQDNTTITVNYVYAAQLGIGTYDIGGLSVNVFTLPLSTTRPLSGIFDLGPAADNAEDWRIRFKFAPSFGSFDFEQTDPDFGKIDIQQHTLAFTPGLELIAPVNDIWAIKPSMDVGLGKIISSSGAGAGDENYFVTYTAGLRSLVELPAREYTFALGNGVIYAGNSELGGSDSEAYWAIETGIQVRRSLGFSLADIGFDNPNDAGAVPEVGIYFVHYYFPDPLLFSRFRDVPLEVNNQFEFGLTLGSATPWDFLKISNPQIGASYIFGDDLDAFRINFGFPF